MEGIERMQARGVATTHLKEYLRKLVKSVEALRGEIGKIEKRLSKMADKGTPDHRSPGNDSGCHESNAGQPSSIDAGPSSNAGHPSSNESDPSSNATHLSSVDVDPSSSTGHVGANSDSNADHSTSINASPSLNADHPIPAVAVPNSDSGHPNESDSIVGDPASQCDGGVQSSQDTEGSTTEHQELSSPPPSQSTAEEMGLDPDEPRSAGVQEQGPGASGTSEVDVVDENSATYVQHCCTSSDEGPSPQDHEQ